MRGKKRTPLRLVEDRMNRSVEEEKKSLHLEDDQFEATSTLKKEDDVVAVTSQLKEKHREELLLGIQSSMTN